MCKIVEKVSIIPQDHMEKKALIIGQEKGSLERVERDERGGLKNKY